jgi:hypothetical protein
LIRAILPYPGAARVRNGQERGTRFSSRSGRAGLHPGHTSLGFLQLNARFRLIDPTENQLQAQPVKKYLGQLPDPVQRSPPLLPKLVTATRSQ